MPKTKLTKRVVDDAKPMPPATHNGKTTPSRYILWDTELRGFGLRVEASGQKTFILYYRSTDGTQRKPTLGTYGAVTVQQAREIAQSMLASVRAGADPSAARQDARQAPTVKDACEKFMKEHASLKKPLTKAQYESLIDRHVKPALGARKVASIQHEDIARLVRAVGKKHPIAANRLRAVLSKLFALTEKWRWRPAATNPCIHIERYRENKVHRDLAQDELVRLAAALEAEAANNSRAVAALRLLLFTGCRRNEVLHLKWSEVDLDRGMLRLGDSKTGAKIVHMNGAAREVLEAQEAVPANPFVFPGHAELEKGPKPISDAKRAWDRVRKAAGLEDVRLHDLRHNFASYGAAEGLSLPLIGKLLGHKNPTTTARYAELADDPARRAAEAVGRAIASAMKPTPLPAESEADA
jgi:integrase